MTEPTSQSQRVSTIPAGWSIDALERSVRIHSGIAPGDLHVLPDGEIPYVKVDDLNNCDKYQSQSREYLASCRSVVPLNALIFPKRGAAIFANKIRIAARPLALDTNLMGVEVISGLDPEFLYYAISQAGLHRLADTSTIPQLNNKHVLPFMLPRPCLEEQRRIANILSTWDQAIATAEQLLVNSKRCSRDLMSSLLAGHRRFPGHSERWRYVDFDAIFERVTRKNAAHNTNVLTISAEHGLISQRDYFKKSVASANLSGYTLLHRHDFAYNKSYSAGYPMGAIKPLLAYEAGVVSSLYLCFRLREDVDADFDFFRHYFEAGLLNQEIEGIAQEGARNHGLLNVSVTDFFKLKLHIPSAPEQRRIAEVINAARAEEALLEAQIRALRQEKAALMSQLLTGKRRVKLTEVESEAQV